MPDIHLRSMTRSDWPAVANLIYDSTNAWYAAHARAPIFTGPREIAQLFCHVYEALDPGCCVLAEDVTTGRLAGSCFFHPRPTHVSLGIMNVCPDYFGSKVGCKLLNHIIAIADAQLKPMRLVSSAMNLDSYSLYNRAGFVPRVIYHDMIIKVPKTGFAPAAPGWQRVRPGRLDDVPYLAALEFQLSGISRENDLRYFVLNADGIWHVSVYENELGIIDGYLASIAHPASTMLGPGVARSDWQAAALIAAELDVRRGTQPVWLVPAQCETLVRTMYSWGAVNCELHFAQSRGPWTPPNGIVLPTFMPETG